MSTVNLVEKIERKRKGLPEGRLNFRDRFAQLQAEGNVLSSKEKLMIFMMIICVGSIFGVRYYVAESLIKSETEELAQQEQVVDQDLAAAVAKLKSFEGIKAEIDSFDKKVTDLKAKIALVDSVQKGRNSIVRMIDFVINEMPQSVWLTKVTITRDTGTAVPAAAPVAAPTAPGAPGTPVAQPAPVAVAATSSGKIEILGFATSLQLVSVFVTRLQGAVFFPNWQLVETSGDAASGTGPAASLNSAAGAPPPDSKKFEINASVVNP